MHPFPRSLARIERELHREERRLARELQQVRHALSTLNGSSTRERAPRRLSPAGRAAISRAARKRWAAYRAQQKRGAR